MNSILTRIFSVFGKSMRNPISYYEFTSSIDRLEFDYYEVQKMAFDPTVTGNKIRILREERKMSQFKLGDKLDLTRVYIGKLERGESVANVRIYVAIADFFDVSLDYLLADKTNDFVRAKIQTAVEILESVERSLK